MAITVTCTSCSQACAVADEHAGMQVRCPKCGNVINVAPLPTAAPATATPVAAAPPPPPSAGPAPTGTGPDFGALLSSFFQAVGLDAQGRTLLYVGFGCLAVMLLSTFLPWISISITFEGITAFGGSVIGIRIWFGTLLFLVTGGALGFFAFVIFGKQPKLFDIALWVGAGWSGLSFLWRLANIIEVGSLAGFGLWLCLLASLGAAGSLGFVLFQRITKKA